MLNPTSGVKAKQPLGLSYKKDASRPGGGVFVLHGNASEDIKDLVPGLIITSEEGSEEVGSPKKSQTVNSGDERTMSGTSSPFAPPLPGDEVAAAQASKGGRGPGEGSRSGSLSAMVNLTPLRGGAPTSNVNPAMSVSGPGNVQVMNVLDVPQASNNTLVQLSNADVGFLEGIPGGMFDWSEFSF